MTSKEKPPMTRPPIANLADVALETRGNGQGFVADVGAIGPLIGAQKLGCSLVVVPAGKKAWPYHLQYANEEMFVILEGEGTLRHDGERYPIRAGDVIASPVGKPHQILNTSDAELRYLAISTMLEPDIAEYPELAQAPDARGLPTRPTPLPALRHHAERRHRRLLRGRGVGPRCIFGVRCVIAGLDPAIPGLWMPGPGMRMT